MKFCVFESSFSATFSNFPRLFGMLETMKIWRGISNRGKQVYTTVRVHLHFEEHAEFFHIGYCRNRRACLTVVDEVN